MFIEQLYLGCLAQASYLIGAAGVAAVIDPRRDVDDYIALAEREGLRIAYVIETHLHADFVSGHQELAARTGAQILMSRAAQARFAHRALDDGDELALGDARLRFLATPGHTPESICVLAYDSADAAAPTAIFTGDTLFIGDVGRPDLSGARGISSQAMAGMLFDSLHGKILPLRDDLVVYPGHGAGSLCGKNMSKETWSTLGEQRRANHALQPMTRAAFVRLMSEDLPEAPAYFGHDVAMNRGGAVALADLPPAAPLTPAEFAALVAEGAVALDVRTAALFAAGHVPGAINIGLDGQFASWAGTLLPLTAAVVLAAGSADEARQAQLRLARVGIERVVGYLEGAGDMAAWRATGRPLASFALATPAALATRIGAAASGKPQVLDVRRRAEWNAGHIEGAAFLPLDRLASETPELDRARPLVVVCAGGYRASTACSILAARGFTDLTNLEGGMSAWSKAGGAVTTAP